MSDLTTELQSLLGAEAGDGWIRFMDKVAGELPFLLDAGRPSKGQISSSQIGQLGFKSWKAMIESMGWNESGWRAWSRAYRVVIEFPYLRHLGISASAINTAWNKSKENDDFPGTADAWAGSREATKSAQELAKASSLANAQKELSRLQDQLKHATRALVDVKRVSADLETRIARYNALGWVKRLFSDV